MTTTSTQIPDRSDGPAFRKYAAEVMLSDGPWEIKWKEPHWNKSWQKQDEPSWDWSQFDYRIYLPPPAPQWQPWTFETAPMERMKVREKKTGRMVSCVCHPDGVGVVYGIIPSIKQHITSYDAFLRDFEHLDGTPLGVKVENEEWPQWYRNRSGDVWRMDSENKGEFFERCGGIDSASMSLSQLKAHASMTRITAAEAADLLAKGKQV